MKPALTIVVPAYNEEKYLGDCLRAIVAETKASAATIEIIVIDNASTDGTAEVARTFANVRVVHEEAKGLTRAREAGLRAAQGDLLAYVDADTRMPRGWVATVLTTFGKNPKIVCVSGPYEYYDISKTLTVLIWLYWHFLAYPIYLGIGYMAVGGNFAIRKSAMEKVGGFDQTISFYGEDTDLARRLASVGTVQFLLSLAMPTSGRRFHGEGAALTAWRYVLNFLSEVALHKPVTSEYTDIR